MAQSLKKQRYIYGRHPVVDAIQAGQAVDKLLLQRGIHGEFEKTIRHLCRDFNIPMQVVPKEKLNKVVRGNHQGVIAITSLVTYYKLEDVLPTIYERSETPLFLLLDGVTDVRNFGAIARSAELCGVHAIVIPKKGSAQINSEALKTAAGALSKIPVCRASSLITAIEYLKLSGIHVAGAALEQSKLIYEADLTIPLAVVLGAEGEGISKAVLAQMDECIKIPQIGTTNSFNVAVSGGIILYEVMRQRVDQA